MPMRRLEATADTVHFGFYDASLAPVFEVNSGEEFWVNTVSADPNHEVPAEWIPPAIPEIFSHAPRGSGPHILTGPIAVRDALAGDVLQIDILDIRLTQPYGYNIVSPLKGMFGSENPKQLTTIIPIDLQTGLARVTDHVSVPTSPFFGQLGVAPPHAWERLDSRPPSRTAGISITRTGGLAPDCCCPLRWREPCLASATDTRRRGTAKSTRQR
jgi:acetamidase/formamidase